MHPEKVSLVGNYKKKSVCITNLNLIWNRLVEHIRLAKEIHPTSFGFVIYYFLPHQYFRHFEKYCQTRHCPQNRNVFFMNEHILYFPFPADTKGVQRGTRPPHAVVIMGLLIGRYLDRLWSIILLWRYSCDFFVGGFSFGVFDPPLYMPRGSYYGIFFMSNKSFRSEMSLHCP